MPAFQSIDKLVDQMREDNVKAFSILYKQNRKALNYFTYQLVNDQFVAQEIVNEVFMGLWELRENFENIQNVRAYLYVSCRNRSYDHLRQRINRSRITTEMFEEQQSNRTDLQDPDVYLRIVEAELMQTLYNEVKTLPKQQSRVLEMIYFKGLDTKTIAKQLGLSEQTVRNTQHAGLKKLKTQVLARKLSPLILLFLLQQEHTVKSF